MGLSSTKPVNIEIEKFVKESITKDRVVIFSKIHCPYCTMAKKQFQNLNVNYLAIEIGDRQDGGEIQDVLNDMTGVGRTVPKVFIDGVFIGGGTDVKKLYESGELAKMVN